MKIVLAVVRGEGSPAAEETFEQPVVKVGRDANVCDLVFDNQLFRMVSRHHADFRFTKGKWMVGDMGSSFGTYLNGKKLDKPDVLSVGASIQFGQDGPLAHVIWLEGGATDQAPAPARAVPVASRPEPSAIPAPLPPEPSIASKKRPEQHLKKEPVEKAAGSAELAFAAPDGTKRFKLDHDIFWFGRDPKCDLVIEASAVMVSRRHAKIRRSGSAWLLDDNQSFNGTLVNDQRISSPTPLYNGDQIRLGPGGPLITFTTTATEEPVPKTPSGKAPAIPPAAADLSGTMVFNIPKGGTETSAPATRQLIVQTSFDGRSSLTVGRNPDNDITLDGLQISKKHATLREAGGEILVEDLNSTNGVYIEGRRVAKGRLGVGDAAQIGSFEIELDEYGNVCVYDTRSKTRIDAIAITKDVKNRTGPGLFRLLNDISLSINPNEFVGMLGPSGAGKSTLMDAINGMRPPTSGTVYVNGQDLYRYIDSLKQSIGYVPQNEIIHGGLTVDQTLYYIAKLRLSSDVTRDEISQIIDEVLDVTGLTERRRVTIDQLSGGQRKRVAIAVELITKPSVIYLDEPTSGLDPATEEKIMLLFRQIAESGRTVVLTTHAMENVKLFDKVVVLMRGRLVFYGKPDEALKHFEAESFKDLYDKMLEPVEKAVAERGEESRPDVTEEAATDWQKQFRDSRFCDEYVNKPLSELSESDLDHRRKKIRLGVFGGIRQWITLTGRYSRVLARDRFNLLILFAQAPVIAFLVYIVMGANFPRDFAYFALSLCAIWFGTSVAAREIVRERRIYERERMVNLGILPYLLSKYTVLGFIVSVQCLMLFIPLKFLDLTGLMPMPGWLGGLPQLFTMLLTGAVGISIGLFVSAVVRTSEMATSLIPLILIPQIIFSGLIGVPSGINKVVGLTMPATWSFDTMKRFSTIETLEPEGERPGLYKSIEDENDRIISDAKNDIRDYEKDLETRLKDAERRAANGEQVRFTGLPERPKVGDAKKVPEDLSAYITFLHPWMHELLNIFVLWVMFFSMFVFAAFVLKIQDYI